MRNSDERRGLQLAGLAMWTAIVAIASYVVALAFVAPAQERSRAERDALLGVGIETAEDVPREEEVAHPDSLPDAVPFWVFNDVRTQRDTLIERVRCLRAYEAAEPDSLDAEGGEPTDHTVVRQALDACRLP